MTSSKMDEKSFRAIIVHSEKKFQQRAAIWLEGWL